MMFFYMMAMEPLPPDTNLATWPEIRSTITNPNIRLNGDMMFGYITNPKDPAASCAAQSADCAIPDDKKSVLLEHFQQLAKLNYFRLSLFQKKDEYKEYTDITPSQRRVLNCLSKGLIENTTTLHRLSECALCQHALRLGMSAHVAVGIKIDEEEVSLLPDDPQVFIAIVQSIEEQIDHILRPPFTHMINVYQEVFPSS